MEMILLSDISILDHFINVSKMVQIGSGAYREQNIISEKI